jgi:hypothetical protein
MSQIRIQNSPSPWPTALDRLSTLPSPEALGTVALQTKGNDKASWATPKPIRASGTVEQTETAPRTPSKGAAGFVFRGQQNDRKAGDFPRVDGKPTMPADWKNNPWLSNEVRMQTAEPDGKLLNRLNTEVQIATHGNPIGTALMNHFISGSGKPFVSSPGSAWSNRIRESGEGKRISETMAVRIHGAAEEQYRKTGKVDLGTLKIQVHPEDRAVWGNKPWNPAWGAFGSTDGLQVEIRNAKFDPVSKQVTGTMRVTIIDTFGVSNADWDSPGQVAMWLLQHQRGYKPFIQEVQFDVPLSFKVRTSPPQGGGNRPIP